LPEKECFGIPIIIMLKSYDVFTGVGGLTWALRGLAVPLLYCEKDDKCRQVLQVLMNEKGLLPKALIHDDIQTLQVQQDHKEDIDMIVGGWPCVGFSVSGKRQGFENAQSGLFEHMMRLVKEIRPKFIFQENVPGVCLSHGLDAILEAFDTHGYDAWWVVQPAYSVGCPQRRKRWYCLAVRRDVQDGSVILTQKDDDAPYIPYYSQKYGNQNYVEPCPRMILEKKPHNAARIIMLGNSVVPDSVRRAFLMLWTGCRLSSVEDVLKASSWTFQRPIKHPMKKFHSTSAHQNKYYGMYVDKCLSVMSVPKDMTSTSCPDLKLVLDPNVFHPSQVNPNPQNTLPILAVPRYLPVWNTPRHGCSGVSLILTMRTSKDLPTQIRFEQNTPDHLRKGYANANFVEHVMGLPQNWTEF
jgi:DNA-cytosine methyltransferase